MNKEFTEAAAKLIAEGKSDLDIAKALIAMKAGDPELVAKMIGEAREAQKVMDALNAKEVADKKAAEKSAEMKEIEDNLLKKMKSVAIQPQVKTKRFNFSQGKEVEMGNSDTKAYEAFDELLKCSYAGKLDRAKSISKEIDQENAMYGQKDARSDADANGAYAVPTTVRQQVMKRTYTESAMLPSATKMEVPYESAIVPVMSAITFSDITNQETDLTESNSTFTAGTITMNRCGAITYISNDFISQRGNIVDEFIQLYGSAQARYIDTRLAIGNVTGAGEPIDGIVFQDNVTKPTAIARTSLQLSDLIGMTESMSDESNDDALRFICNRKVYNQIASMTDTDAASGRVFPQFLSGGAIEPFGIPMIKNSKITSVLDIGGDDNTGGTDDVLILVDMSKLIVAMSGGLRIETSKEFKFGSDQLAVRGLTKMGWVLPISEACVVLELTN